MWSREGDVLTIGAAFTLPKQLASLFVAAGTSERDAETMARLLVEQDMAQGDGHPKSHGTRCITNYHGEDAEHAGWQVRAHSHPPPASPPPGAETHTSVGPPAELHPAHAGPRVAG